jgi:tetrahydromethanopterin S-methyltransferase subunit G
MPKHVVQNGNYNKEENKLDRIKEHKCLWLRWVKMLPKIGRKCGEEECHNESFEVKEFLKFENFGG